MCCGGVSPASTPQGGPQGQPQGLAVKKGKLGMAKVNLLNVPDKKVIENGVALRYNQSMTGSIYYGPVTSEAYRIPKEKLIYVHPEDVAEMVRLREAGKDTFTLVEDAPKQQPSKKSSGGLEARLTGEEPPDPFGGGFAGNVSAAEAALSNVIVPADAPQLPEEKLNAGLAKLLDSQQAKVEEELFGSPLDGEEEDEEGEEEEDETPVVASTPAKATRSKARRKKTRK